MKKKKSPKDLSIRMQILNRLPYDCLHFLIENNCLSRYMKNYLNEKSVLMLDNNNNLVIHKRDFISSAFSWHYTEEGYHYWNNLDYKWELQRSESAYKS